MSRAELNRIWEEIDEERREFDMAAWEELARSTFDLPHEDMMNQLVPINEAAIMRELIKPEDVTRLLDALGRPAL